MNIVFVNCLKANTVCTGAACLQALNERRKSFEAYKGEEVQVQAFMRCSGCGETCEKNAGMQEKLERIISMHPDVAHFGKCTFEDGKLCETLQSLEKALQEAGIKTVLGTH